MDLGNGVISPAEASWNSMSITHNLVFVMRHLLSSSAQQRQKVVLLEAVSTPSLHVVRSPYQLREGRQGRQLGKA